MPWRAVRRDRRWDIDGPVGDTLRVKITATDPDIDWNAFAWSGAVRQRPDSPTTVAAFNISSTVDGDTVEVLGTIPAATTAAWAAHDQLHWAIVGHSGADRHTVAAGIVKPRPAGS